MKKAANQTKRKLVVSREAIVQLTPVQIRNVGGGNSWSGWPPFCVGDTDTSIEEPR